MVFSELYGAYYNAVAGILRKAIDQPMNKTELRELIEKNAFGESMLNIEPAINEERWQIIKADGTTQITHYPTMPLTTLQKRWIKAIYSDPRIRLFTDEEIDFQDVKPLFTKDDIDVFDKYDDGDPYDDANYIRNFRLILDAIKNRYALDMDMKNNEGKVTRMVMVPEYLEYSEKDDKFRVIGSSRRYGDIVNVGRIIRCEKSDILTGNVKKPEPKEQVVVFELTDKRNALERVLLHFAHFKKQVEKIEDDKYKVSLSYDKDDETEIVIRILSFGPVIKVLGPQQFVYLIEERLIKQMNCNL